MQYPYSPETLEPVTGTLPDSMKNTLPFLDVPPPEVSANQYVVADPDAGEWIIKDSVPEVDVPDTITPRQARLQLAAMGLLGDVELAVASLPDGQRQVAEIEWKYATQYERTHPFIGQMAGVLDIEMDQFFIAASKL